VQQTVLTLDSIYVSVLSQLTPDITRSGPPRPSPNMQIYSTSDVWLFSTPTAQREIPDRSSSSESSSQNMFIETDKISETVTFSD